jgi:hypothetical protein
MLTAVLLNVVMLTADMLNVVMLNVVAPIFSLRTSHRDWRFLFRRDEWINIVVNSQRPSRDVSP